MSKYSIAVIGDLASVMGFKALGLDVHVVQDVEDARRALHTLAKGDAAVIYITEAFARDMTADIDRYKEAVTPAVILIPGKEGSLGIGMSNMESSIMRAVGADIL